MRARRGAGSAVPLTGAGWQAAALEAHNLEEGAARVRDASGDGDERRLTVLGDIDRVAMTPQPGPQSPP